jgi:mannose-6-phosphate isomerase-like protein (cupin superfamily)
MQVGETIYNRVTGEEMTLLEKSIIRTRHRFTLPPHGQGVFLHIHTTFVEKFLVLNGELDMIVGDPKRPFKLQAGQRGEVPLRSLRPARGIRGRNHALEKLHPNPRDIVRVGKRGWRES